MTPLANAHLKNRTRQRWLVAVLLASLILLAGFPGHSTAKLESTPVTPQDVSNDSLGSLASVGESPLKRGVHHPASAFAPFLNIVPSQDGTELYISAGTIGELGGTAFVNIGIGPTHDKGSYTMVYSDTGQAYVATATGFTPNTGASGPINITTTLGLDTGAVDFNRAYVPASTIQTIGSIDGNLELTLVSTDTVTFDTYVAIVPSYAPPGPAPLGYRFVGSSYSVRAAGALLVSDKPMSLRMYYNETTLAGTDPHTLAIFAWDAFNERWDDLGGHLFYDQGYLSVATSRFTTYALMATPVWRDDFDDFSGLAEVNDVTLDVANQKLILSGTAISGTAVSKPITPTLGLSSRRRIETSGAASWGSLTFTRTVNPPTTTLTVDVLSLDGSEVLTDAVSGASLAGIDPAQYPALKLRANLSSTVAGETPALDEWQLTWQVEEHRVYLPVVLR